MAFTFEYKAQIAESTSDPITVNVFTGTYSKLIILHIAVTGNSFRKGGDPGLTPSGTLFTQTTPPVVTTEGNVEMWHLINDDVPKNLGISIDVPNSGFLDITTSTSIYNTASASWAELYGTFSGTGSGTSPSGTVSIPIGENYVSVDSMFSGQSNLLSFSNSDILLYSNDTGDEICACQYYVGSNLSSTKNMNYTIGSDDWAILTASFDEIPIPEAGTISTINGVTYDITDENYILTVNGVNRTTIGSVNGVIP